MVVGNWPVVALLAGARVVAGGVVARLRALVPGVLALVVVEAPLGGLVELKWTRVKRLLVQRPVICRGR